MLNNWFMATFAYFVDLRGESFDFSKPVKDEIREEGGVFLYDFLKENTGILIQIVKKSAH